MQGSVIIRPTRTSSLRYPTRSSRSSEEQRSPFDLVLDAIGFWDNLGSQALKVPTIVKRISTRTNVYKVQLHHTKTDEISTPKEWRINLRVETSSEPIPFLVEKQSTLPGSNLGIFAARNFKMGEYIGIYLGVVLQKLEGNTTEEIEIKERDLFKGRRYVMTYGNKGYVDARAGIDHHSHPRAYMGCHMINDPTYNLSHDCSDDEKRNALDLVNVVCYDDLLVAAQKDISDGQEFFLRYAGDQHHGPTKKGNLQKAEGLQAC